MGKETLGDQVPPAVSSPPPELSQPSPALRMSIRILHKNNQPLHVLHSLPLHPSLDFPVPLLLLDKFNTTLKASLADKVITLTTIELNPVTTELLN